MGTAVDMRQHKQPGSNDFEAPVRLLPQPAAIRRVGVLACVAAIGLGLAACTGDAGTSQVAGARIDQTATAPAPTAIPIETQVPRMLPVTPVSVQYEVVDPSFEALPGARAIFGEHNGAGYRIEVPANWNGDVVYYAHGFRGNPPQLTIDMPPLREYLIARGYAWAASSYSKNGYEPGVAARDMLALRDVVTRELGDPGRSYIWGQSMGGHVVSLSLEQYPDAYDGALSECGVVSGHEILDYFLSWGALAGYLTGVELYDVTTDVGAFAVRVKDRVVPALGDPRDPSRAGRAFISAVERMTGGPRPFFFEGLLENYEFNFVILVNAVGAAGPANAASQNIDVEYEVADGLGVTSDQINREIARIEAQTAYRDIERYPEFADMTGEFRTPLLTLHNTGDLFVPISLEQSYRQLADAAGNGDLLVQRAIRRPGHCNFTEAERTRAFDDLVAWVERGARPAGDDLSGDLRDVGRAFTSPATDGDPGGIAAR